MAACQEIPVDPFLLNIEMVLIASGKVETGE